MMYQRNGVICIPRASPKKNNTSAVVFCTRAFHNGLSLLETIYAGIGTFDAKTIILAWEVTGLPIYNDQHVPK